MVSYEYIAGFFDGEGYVRIAKKSPNSHSGAPYWLSASMANTHRGVLDEIQKVAGGRVIFHAGDKKKKPHYRLTFYTLQAVNFIKAIQPYLIVKREEADIAIAFAERLKIRHYGLRLTQKELDIRHNFYLRLKGFHGNRGADKENVSNLGLKSS